MRRFSIFLGILFFVAVAAGAYAQTSPTIVTPSQLKWSSAGPSGISMAVVTGNPNAAGTYVVRLKMNPGAKFPVHTHGMDERVTILQGNLLVGIGPKWNNASMKAYPAGTYAIIPAGVPHYVMAKDAVIVEVTGQGPFTTKMMGGGKPGM